jgi:hypothetical protein
MLWLIGCVQSNEDSFVLLELFTSQSCFACPPADEDLNEIAQRQEAEDTRQFAMAWHVDYWNDLGWVDPYSLEEASERQFAYVDAIPTHRYTPQMVANGQEDFVGGYDAKRLPAIERWLSRPASVHVELEVGEIVDGELMVEVLVEGAPEGTELVVALLQSGIVTEILSGENAGKTLAYDNVVRSVVHERPEVGRVTLGVPEGVEVEDMGIVGFVQEMGTMEVLGAELVGM